MSDMSFQGVQRTPLEFPTTSELFRMPRFPVTWPTVLIVHGMVVWDPLLVGLVMELDPGFRWVAYMNY